MNKKFLFYIILILAIFLLVINYFTREDAGEAKADFESNTEIPEDSFFSRQSTFLYYSKHARCRMGCRHIDEDEVIEILEDGIINFTKSDLISVEPCRKKYALEGRSNDGQNLRIIFAPCSTRITVVTVIDLDTEWNCNCY